MQSEKTSREIAAWRLELRDEVSSTNTVLKEMALAGEAEGKVLIARRQRSGKGRMGRSFYSPEETGVYMSMLLRPNLTVQESLLLTTAAAVAVAGAIEQICQVEAQIKWVNDIYCHGKKVVGILTESALQTPTGASHAPQLSYAIVGIGINLWTPTAGFPKELQTIAGSVLDRPRQKEESDLRLALAKAVLERFEAFYRALPARTFMEEYRRRSLLIGQTVRVLDANHRAIEGYPPVTVLDVGDEAELIVALPDGTRRAIHSGEVSVRPENQ